MRSPDTRVAIVAIAGLLACSGCHTYSGAKTTTLVGACTLPIGGGLWISSRVIESPDTSTDLKWAAIGTASLGALLVLAGVIGMVALPTDNAAAVQLANILVTKAHEGECTTVRARANEVEELDSGVYDRVLLADPAAAKCLSR